MQHMDAVRNASTLNVMRQSMHEDLIERDVYAARLRERYTLLSQSDGTTAMARTANVVAMVDSVEKSLLNLYPSLTYAYPAAARVNSTFMAYHKGSVAW